MWLVISLLGKNGIGFVLSKRGKKRGKTGGKQHRKGDFRAETRRTCPALRPDGCRLGEGLLEDEAEVPQQFAIGVGFGVIGGKEFVAVEDGVRAGKKTQRLRFPRQP